MLGESLSEILNLRLAEDIPMTQTGTQNANDTLVCLRDPL